MFRFLLALQLLVLSLTGPTTCCCMFGSVLTKRVQICGALEVQRSPCCQGSIANVSADGESQSDCELPAWRCPSGRCKCEKDLSTAFPSQKSSFAIGRSRSGLDVLALNPSHLQLQKLGDVSVVASYPGGNLPKKRSGRMIRIENHSWLC